MELSVITNNSIGSPPERAANVPAEKDRNTGDATKASSAGQSQSKTGADKVSDKVSLSGKNPEDPQIQAQIARLKANEEKIKAHEAAHKAAGGNLAGPASFTYTKGPDGRSYITGGEVQINISSGKTPDETISRMQQVIRAALAPADPSGQDRAVAAQAASQLAQAQTQKAQEDQPGVRAGREEEAKPLSASAGQAARAYTNPAVLPYNSRDKQEHGSSAPEKRSGQPQPKALSAFA